MNRRVMLRLLTTVAVGSLAGCGDGESDGAASPTTAAPGTDAASQTPTATATATPTETATRTGTATEPATGTTSSGSGDVAEVVTVGDGGFRFDPDRFEIAVGETVVWVWRSSNHNVVPNEIPAGSDWDGTAGGPAETYDTGHELRVTFETPGTYTYYCAPHRDVGMRGSFTVTA